MNRLRDFRLKKNYSQWRLAKESGCHQSRISLGELDLVELRPREKENLAKALGIEIEEIFPENERDLQ